MAGSGGAGSRPSCLVENGKPLKVEPSVQEKDLPKETSSLNIEMVTVAFYYFSWDTSSNN